MKILLTTIVLACLSASGQQMAFPFFSKATQAAAGGGSLGPGTYSTMATNKTSEFALTASSVPAGSLAVVTVADENATSAYGFDTTLTMTCRGNAAQAGAGRCAIYTAPCSGTVSVGCYLSSGSGNMSGTLYILTNLNASPIGIAITNLGSAAPTMTSNLTAHSFVACVSCDFAAVVTNGLTFRTPPTAAQIAPNPIYVSGAYTAYHYYYADTGAGGSETFGISTPSTMNKANSLALEIKGP